MDSFERPNKQTIWKSANQIATIIKLKYEEHFSNSFFKPIIAIICGSGLGNIAEILDGDDEKMKNKRLVISYKDIPYMPVSKVDGHLNQLTIGFLNGKYQVLCFQGRTHLYEGYQPWEITLPVRAMKLMGVETLFVTNCSGCLSKNFKSGDVMIIKDHIDFAGLAGQNPLIGDNDDRWGLRFPDLRAPYCIKLRKLTLESANSLHMSPCCKEGIYLMVCGPNYETNAEKNIMTKFGADAIGASTVSEVIVARHCQISVCGLSLITTDYQDPLEKPSEPLHADHIEMVLALSFDEGSRKIGQIIKETVARM
ncbi:unnamed protein product [Gordionus sp. m RMFG-2023]|uniref:purine nucleoside phosphorylase-like n=1 Tax=Gordionus sp. m RMFG-2023 TaxID=3053472 RepID=UPI0030E1C986